MHYAVIPSADRTKVLVSGSVLPAVETDRIRTSVVVDTIEDELGVCAPFLRVGAVVRDEERRPVTALHEFDAPRSAHRPEWVAVDEVPGLVPDELRERAGRWLAEQRGAPIPDERAPWARPGWLAEAEAWLKDAVAVVGEARLHAQWPLSAVLRAETPDGVVYLKAAFSLFRHEPALTRALGERHPGLVPSVVAIDADRGWLLMREVEGALLGNKDRSCWTDAVAPLAEVHRTWAGRRAEVLALGATDRALATLDAPPELEPQLEALADLGIDETLVHGDFHPWNVFVNGKLVLYDWSDACYSHPLFDLLTYGFRQDLAPVLDAYGVAAETWAIAAPLAAIHHAISYERILAALEPDDRWLFEDVPRQLREFASGNADHPW